MWNSIELALGAATHHGRYRVEGDMLVLEWRGGRHAERCGLLKPDLVATQCLRQLLSQHRLAA